VGLALGSILKINLARGHAMLQNMGMQTTKPCSAKPEQSGQVFPGTIGLDLYLSVIGAERCTLRSPRIPRLRPDLSPLLASFALAHPDLAEWFVTNKGK